jgi:hypothetical protein
MCSGGAISVARESGLLAWKVQEINKLDTGITQEAFHRAIQAKYP